MAGNIFSDPIQLFGFCFIIITMLIFLILALKVYRDYLINRSKPTLAFSLTFASWGLALIFLGLERFALSVLVEYGFSEQIGITFAYIAFFSVIPQTFLGGFL
jgi:hypothetical protein